MGRWELGWSLSEVIAIFSQLEKNRLPFLDCRIASRFALLSLRTRCWCWDSLVERERETRGERNCNFVQGTNASAAVDCALTWAWLTPFSLTASLNIHEKAENKTLLLKVIRNYRIVSSIPCMHFILEYKLQHDTNGEESIFERQQHCLDLDFRQLLCARTCSARNRTVNTM